MSKYIIKRVLFLIPTVLGVTFIIYAVMNITPGDPGRAILGANALQADVDAYNHMLGYDLPFFQKFTNYIKGLFLEGDFGISYFTKQSVFVEIWPRFLFSARLALFGLFFSAVIGVPLGIYAAVKQYTLWDTIPSLASFFVAAIPGFVIGMVLLYIFALKLNWLPSYGANSWTSYIMPVIAMTISTAALNMRFTKSSMLESIRQDYIRTARAKGAPEKSVIWNHALKNALIPVVTQMGMTLGVLIAGAVVTEKLYSLPGIGSLIVDRIPFKDEPIVIGGTILLSVCFAVIMLLVDLLYAFIDPRIKAKYSKMKGK